MESLQSIKEEIQTAQAALEVATEKLKELENAQKQKPKKSLIASPVAGSGDEYFTLSAYGVSGRLFVSELASNNTDEDIYKGLSFTTEKEAVAYAEAFETMVMLRKCDGSVKPNDDKYQCVFRYMNGKFQLTEYMSIWYKTEAISPTFVTKEDARNAIKKVGEERVIRMFNTFSGDI